MKAAPLVWLFLLRSTIFNSMDIIIIGAGAAGLMAARELSPLHKVTILEAKDQPGGRIHTIKPTIEAGAEFIHGRLPVTLNLLKEAGLSYTPVKGKMYSVEKGQWSQDENFTEGWDELLDKINALQEDMTLLEFLETYYGSTQHADLRAEITRYVQGFDLANPSKVSVKYLHKEWTSEDPTNFRVDEGYDALIRFLAKDVNIISGSPVKSIRWEKGKVQVQTENGQSYYAHKVIITTSIGVLQYGAIRFTPAIDDYLNAASHIGWGSVIKIVLEFKEAFWKKDTGFIFSKEKIPTWWTQSPHTSPVLTGWLGGPPAEHYKQVPGEEILQTALHTLSEIFQTTLPPLVSSHISNWIQDPAILGSYSYDTPRTKTARELLNTPLEDTIYFAGEALYEGNHPGTVEAALISGKAAAQKISLG